MHVPSLPAGTPVPEGFRVRSFACVEQDHYVWVWMGDGAPTHPAPAPIRDLHAHGWTQGVVEAACSADRQVDNILDSSHIPFVHTGTHWSYFLNKMFGFKNYEYETRLTDNGVAVFYPPAADASQGFLNDDVRSYLEFELPDRFYVFQRGVKTNFYLVIHMVACGPERTRIEWLMQSRDRSQGVEWVDGELATLAEDRALLQSAEGNYAREGAGFERHVPADFPPLLARRLLQMARAGDWPDKRPDLVQRKLVSVRQ